MQLKVGPTKKIAKIPAVSQPRVTAAIIEKTIAAEKASVPSTEPLVKLRDNVKDKLSMLKHIKVDSAALKVAVKKLDDKAKRVPLKETPQVNYQPLYISSYEQPPLLRTARSTLVIFLTVFSRSS